ncbi:MAG: hypothetical protein KDA47_02150, partial [Planctomycetales bacterium]|nr:hypothetical protein [Planctomycetales bacterium]
QKPADLAGAIVDGQGEQVAEFRSEHEGRGRFAFTPAAGQKYSMRIDEPAGIAALYPLPEVAEKGTVLSTEQDAFAADEPVNVQVRAAGLDGDLLVTLSKRESVIGRMNVEAVDGSVDKVAKFELAESDADGVLIATVWDSQGNPLAERLVFRQPAKQVRVKISADAEQYIPGGTARLTIETTDESGKPLSAVVGLAVTDDSVLEMIEKREQAPRLPVMVLLEGDVRELADAHVYLDAENDEAPRQVDLLLGTQGWRRFAFINTEAFVQEHGDDARRVLALQVVTMREWSRSASMFSGGIGGGIAVDRFAAPVDAPGAPIAANEGAPVAQLAASNLKSAPEEAAEAPQSAAALAPAAEQPARDQSAAGQDGQAAPDLANEPVNAEEAKRQQAFRQPQAAGEPNGELRARARGFAEKLDAAADRELALFERDEAATVAEMLTPVRVYAHQVRSDRQPGQRVDFTETLFWHAGLKTDDEGRASVEFGLNDSVTSFRVFADAFTAEGSLGSASTTIESVEPFYIEPKMPLEVTMNDIVRVPLSAVNATNDRLANVGIEVLAQGTQP